MSEADDGVKGVLRIVGERADGEVAKWIESETGGGMKGKRFRLGSMDADGGGEDG